MTQEKQKRLIIAGTVGAVLLVLILVMIMTYQLIAIGVEVKREEELNAAVKEYSRMIEEGEDMIKIRDSYQWIIRRARELGYVFDGDKLIKLN